VLVYWTALTLGPLLLGGSLSLTSYALSASKGVVSALPGAVALGIDLLEFALLASGAALLFRYVPNTHVRWAHAWSGAVFVAIGFDLAKRGLAWYVQSVPGYSVVYGAFATLPILLLWIYLSWLIVLLGAVIAAYAPSLAMHVMRLPDRPGERFALALAALQALAAARRSAQPGLAAETLAGQLRIDPLQVQPVLDDLVALGWCGRLDEAGPQRHVLLIDPAHTPAQPLIDRLLLAEAQRSAGFRQRIGLGALTVADLLG
jgi:membrane protein